MRISDWSSDVCSSDLPTRGIGERTLDEVRKRARTDAVSLWEASIRAARGNELAARARNELAGFHALIDALDGEVSELPQSGRASSRGRVCAFVYISVVPVIFKKKGQRQ